MFYEEVFESLNEARVDYVVAGGVALVLHGVVRLTADLDLAVSLSPDNLEKFVSVMEKLGYKPKAPVRAKDLADPDKREDWIRKKNMRVFSFHHLARPVLIDIFIEENIKFSELRKHSITIKAGEISIPVVSADDLIKMKRASGRPQDLADIEALKELKKHAKS